jgi:multiple sugar transport system permease protein
MQVSRNATPLGRRLHANNSVAGRSSRVLTAYGFLLPALTIFVTFTYYPLLQVFYLSFTDADMISPPQLIGTENYQLLTKDPAFLNSLKITTFFSLATTVLEVILGMALGFLMNTKMRVQGLVRGAVFAPVVVSVTATAILWLYFLNPNVGPLNQLLNSFGLPAPNWLEQTSSALTAVILTNVWKSVGFAAVLYLAGLQAIPEQLREAARVDGANAWQVTRFITVPLLSPTTALVFFISLVGSFQAYGLVLLMTRGGPAGSTNMLAYYLYENAFRFFDMGYAAAISTVLFIVLVAISVLQFKLTESKVHYQ